MMYVFSEDFATEVVVRGLTAKRVAELAGVSQATVAAALQRRPVTVASATRIAQAVVRAPRVPELERYASALVGATP